MRRCALLACMFLCVVAVLAAGREARGGAVTVYQVVASGTPKRGQEPEVHRRLKSFATELKRQGFAKYKFGSVTTKDVALGQWTSFPMMHAHVLNIRLGQAGRRGSTKLDLKLLLGKKDRQKQLLQTEVELAPRDVLILGAWPIGYGHLIFVIVPGGAK